MAKYQIFVSSTYEDLREERAQVIKAIWEMGHIPVGMEMFSAADKEQWKIITRHIDQSDYYVVIVAHKYGSVKGGKSYTELEYDYAVKHRVPVNGFLSTIMPIGHMTKSRATPQRNGDWSFSRAKLRRNRLSSGPPRASCTARCHSPWRISSKTARVPDG